MHEWRTILPVLAFAATGVFGQTQVDLHTQSKNVDFSTASATRPAKTGTTLPSTCNPGEVFFNLAATAGQNLYLCAAANTWTQLTSGSGGGGGGISSASGLTDFVVTRTSSTVLQIGANCSTLAPCNIRFGNRAMTVSNSATATLPSSGSVSGVAYIYVSSQGLISIGDSLGVTCSGCSEQAGVSQFPPDSIPLFTWSATFGSWDASGGVDLRAFLSSKSIIAGTGIVTVDAAGQTMVSADSSVIGVRVASPATATSACTQGSYAADTSFFYQCVATNTWRRVAISAW